MTGDIGHALVRVASALAEPLTSVATPEGLRRVLAAAGWVRLGGIDLETLATNVETITTAVQEAVEDPPSDLLDVAMLVARLAGPAITLGEAVAEAPEAPPELGTDIAEALLEVWLSRTPAVLPVLSVLGAVEDVDLPEIVSGAWQRRPVRRRRVRLDLLSEVIQNPGARLTELLEDPDIVVAELWPVLIDLLDALGIGASTADTDPTATDAADLERVLVIDIVTGHAPAQFTRVAVGVENVPGTGLTLHVAFSPGLDLTLERGGWHAGIAVPGPQRLIINAAGAQLNDTGATTAAAPEVTISAGYTSTSTPAFRFGTADAMHLDVGELSFGVSVTADLQDVDVAGSLALRGLALGVTGTDGFLSSLLGAGGPAQVDGDLVLSLSLRKGISFAGSRAPRLVLSGKRTIGPIDLVDVTIEILIDGGVGVELTAGIVARIGPITARVDRIGVQARLVDAGPTADPAAGPLPLRIGLRPPAGIGVLVAAGPVTGGGYVFLDYDAGTYAGVVQLQFKALALTAIGIVTTRLPGGQPGWSFLLLVAVEFPGIPLGFGISLYAVGGLVGIHRSVDLAKIRDAVRTGRLDSVLFPHDPVANAAQVLADLTSFFPAEADRFTIGVMARLGWGPGPLVTVEAGVILELPSPVRLVIAARLSVILPTKESPVVRLRLDVVGTVDFGRGEISVDGSLIDSRIGPFSLSGDMALRASWGASPTFALSAGGFHPRFPTPDGFPVLRRITIGLADSENPRLRLETYLALTAATVQIGARLEVSVDVEVLGHAVGVSGVLGFDALVHFQPRFGFEVDLFGSVTVSVDGDPWLAASLNLRLSGTSPWHAVGEAKLRISFLPEISARVEATVGEDDASVTATVSVSERVIAELSLPDAFRVLPSSEGPCGVVLRQPAESARAVHPAGRVSVRQAVVPLGPRITRFGGAVPSDPGVYAIAVTIAGAAAAGADALEPFSTGQFRDGDPAETLSRPEYEWLPSGRALGALDLALAVGALAVPDGTDDRVVGPEVVAPVTTPTTPPTAPTIPASLGPCAVSAHENWAAARADRGRAAPGAPDRFTTPRPPARLKVVPERWTLADPATLAALTVPSAPLRPLPGVGIPRLPGLPGLLGPVIAPVRPVRPPRPPRAIPPTSAVEAQDRAGARGDGATAVVVLPVHEVKVP